MFGKELILDLADCDITKFSKSALERFFEELCLVIDMEQVESHFWEDHESPEAHLNGVSAVQFIKTSDIVIHTLTITKAVYINIFTCKDFDVEVATQYVQNWFGGRVTNSVCLKRGL